MKKTTLKQIILIFLILTVLSIPIVIIRLLGIPHLTFEKAGTAFLDDYQTEVNIDDKDLGYLQSIIDVANDNYYGNITNDQLVIGALKGAFGIMDLYSTFFTKDEYKTFIGDVSGTYCGIGISIEKSNDDILVTKTYAASPAEKEGVMPGDRITRVDDKNVLGLSIVEVVNLIKGQANTKVKLGIIKHGEKDTKVFEITRGQIIVNPVIYDIRGDIGYIGINKFNANTEQFVVDALKKVDDKGISKIVLDLRNNSGGLVDQAAALANHFIPKGLIASYKTKGDGIQDREYYSSLEKQKYKYVVLVNGMTASASEMFAGAVQDTASGIVIGTHTFGKARAQSVFPILNAEAYKKYKNKFNVNKLNVYELYSKYNLIPSDSEIIGYAKLTVGYYYTPNGRMIDLKGITPDIVVDDPKLVNNVNVMNVLKLSGKSEYALNSKNIDIYNAKSILKMNGYGVEIADVNLDDKTLLEIKRFQKDTNIKESGLLDLATQQKLNEVLDKLILSYDSQFEKAVEVLNY